MKSIYKNYTLIIVILVSIIVAYSIFHKTPEECFVYEMKKWGEITNNLDKITGITQKDEKKSVAKAKVLISEFNYKDLGDDSKEMYLKVKEVLEYCK